MFYDRFLKVRAQNTVNYKENEATAKCREWVTNQGPFTNTVRTPQINLFGEQICLENEVRPISAGKKVKLYERAG